MPEERRAVLLIDDDADFGSNLADIFERHGMKLDIAGTGAEGVEIVKGNGYDLVLVDLHLPDISGLEAMRRIKEFNSDIEVIVQTGYGAPETAVQALGLGAFSYVAKPVDLEQLISLCQRALERSDSRRVLQQTEEHHRIFFEKTSDVILVADMEGHILDANPAAVKLYGYSLDELRSMPPGGLMTPETRHLMRERIDQVNLEEETVLETEHRRKDGSTVYMEARSNPVQYEGKPAILNVLRDITERKQSEEALRTSEETLRIIFDSVPGYVFFKDRNNILLRVNQALTQSIGLPVEEIIGRPLSELFPDRSEQYWADDLEVIRTGKPKLGIIEPLETPQGTYWVQTDKLPYRNAAGEIVGVIGFSVDITERKKAEEELQRVNEELERFSHMVSHDLRSPLAVMHIAAETLNKLLAVPKAEQQSDSIAEVATMITEASAAADQFVSDLLKLAEAGQRPVEVESVDIAEVVERVLRERAPVMEQRGVRVVRSPDLGRVIADATQMYQLFANLIDNSILHNDNPVPQIQVLYGGSDGVAIHRYLVRDNGSGIAAGDLDKIFMPFFKGERGGTGIGLATVERIIQLYNGTIRAYNDNGACFEFTIRDYSFEA